jgi:murein DD-endopeptidase MepM/ murein hydrolase activator NlpD
VLSTNCLRHYVPRCGILLCALLLSHSAYAALLLVTQDTHLKTSTAQASTLPAASKCTLSKGIAIEVSSVSDGGSDHFRVSLPRSYFGCALTTGFLYQPHVSSEANSLSVIAATVFKKTSASASTLPASSKCDMPVGAYGLSGAPVAEAGHYRVNLKAFLPSCSFSAGYVFDGHSLRGAQVFSLADSAFFKKTTADSSTLPAADKCLLPKGNYALSKAASTNGTHYSISLARAVSGCGFTTGFVFFELSYRASPSGSGATSYTPPLQSGFASGNAGAWCVCRNIGTSPHIGQDWNADVPEKSVAIANGTIINKGFSSTCGHSLTLRDSSGAEWIYRHLNSNSIQNNQAVSKGQFLGNHSDYPLSGCGSGPHLHIERDSAGGFGDSPRFRSCEAGPEPCYYDPNKPFAPKSASASDSASNSAASDAGSLQLVEQATAPLTLKPAQCRANPGGYPTVAADSFVALPQAGSAISVIAQASSYDGQQQLTLGAAFAGNANNQCEKGACITAISVLSELQDGSWRRVLHDASVRDRPVAVLAEEMTCLPASASGRIVVLLKDQNGQRLRRELTL